MASNNRRLKVVIWERRVCPPASPLTGIAIFALEVPFDQDSCASQNEATQNERKMNREVVPVRRSARLRLPIRPA